MRDFIFNWISALARAWQKMARGQLSPKLQNIAKLFGKHHEAAGFVLLGWLLGIAATLAGSLFSWIFNLFTGSFIFALAAWLLIYFHDHARGDGLIAARLCRWLPGESVPSGVIVPVFLMLLKFALLMRLFYCGSGLICSAIIAAGFAMEALLLADADFSPPVFDASEASMRRFWTITVMVLIFTFIGSKPAAALTILGFAVILKYAKERLNEEGLTADDIRFYGAEMIWTAIASGVLTI